MKIIRDCSHSNWHISLRLCQLGGQYLFINRAYSSTSLCLSPTHLQGCHAIVLGMFRILKWRTWWTSGDIWQWQNAICHGWSQAHAHHNWKTKQRRGGGSSSEDDANRLSLVCVLIRLNELDLAMAVTLINQLLNYIDSIIANWRGRFSARGPLVDL